MSVPSAKFFVNRGVVTSSTDMYHLLRPLLKQTVSYRYLRGRDLVAHGTGWVERVVLDHPEISSYFTPLSVCVNVDSFEHLEFETRPDQLLVKMDRATMLVGLEARAPYLDPAVMEFGLRLDPRLKVRGLAAKWLLKQAAPDVVLFGLRHYAPTALSDASKRDSATPLIVLDDRGAAKSAAAAIKDNGCRYLAKPCRRQELIAALRAALAERSASRLAGVARAAQLPGAGAPYPPVPPPAAPAPAARRSAGYRSASSSSTGRYPACAAPACAATCLPLHPASRRQPSARHLTTGAAAAIGLTRGSGSAWAQTLRGATRPI